MTRFAEVFVDLKDTPNIRLEVLLILRVNGVEFAGSTGRREEW
jgi:hypothetical protein